jgi:hypothetical protein
MAGRPIEAWHVSSVLRELPRRPPFSPVASIALALIESGNRTGWTGSWSKDEAVETYSMRLQAPV